MKGLLIICIFTLLTACNYPTPYKEYSRQEQVKIRAVGFFETFAERSDWDKLCSYYREDLVFHDVMLQLHLDSLWKFKRFYDWESTDYEFKKLSPDQPHLTLTNLVVNDSSAIGTGHFNPFYSNGVLIDTEWGMDFAISLYFDKDLMIIKQTDWIEYNDFVLESVIERCRKNGHEALPEWLDLQRR